MRKTINKVLDKNTNSDIPSSLEFEGKRLTRKPDVLEVFNHHFTSIGPKLAHKIEVRNDDDCLQNITTESNNMIFNTVDENYILDAINQLKNGKASGPGDWFESYLKERKQYCAANGHRSNIRKIICGIPQGSCLGPLLS